MDDLGKLHGKLTNYYNKRLDTQLTEQDDEDLSMPLSPAELTAMNNFLKQNEVTAIAEDSEQLSDLQKKLKDKQKKGAAKLASVTAI
jgi:hypothetical protein